MFGMRAMLPFKRDALRRIFLLPWFLFFPTSSICHGQDDVLLAVAKEVPKSRDFLYVPRSISVSLDKIFAFLNSWEEEHEIVTPKERAVFLVAMHSILSIADHISLETMSSLQEECKAQSGLHLARGILRAALYNNVKFTDQRWMPFLNNALNHFLGDMSPQLFRVARSTLSQVDRLGISAVAANVCSVVEWSVLNEISLNIEKFWQKAFRYAGNYFPDDYQPYPFLSIKLWDDFYGEYFSHQLPRPMAYLSRGLDLVSVRLPTQNTQPSFLERVLSSLR